MVLPVCAINMPLTEANRRGRDGVSIGIIIPVVSSEEAIGTMLANVAKQAHLTPAIKISVDRVSGYISGRPRSHVRFSLPYINRLTANCCRVEMSTYFSYRSTSNMPCIGRPRAQLQVVRILFRFCAEVMFFRSRIIPLDMIKRELLT